MGVQVCKQISIEVSKKNRLDLVRTLMKRREVEIVTPKEATTIEDSYLNQKQRLQETGDYLNHVLDFYRDHQIYIPKSHPIFETRTKISAKEYDKLTGKIEDFREEIKNVSDKINILKKLETKISDLKELIYKTEPLKDIELDIFGDFSFLRFLPFRIEEERAQFVVEEIKKTFSDVEIESIKKIGDEYVYLVATHVDSLSRVSDYIANLATIITFETKELKGTSFYQIYTEAKQELELTYKEIQKLEKEIQKPSPKPEKMVVYRDIISSEINILNTLHAFTKEGRNYILSGYIDPKNLPALEKALSKQEVKHTITVAETQSTDTVKVENNSFVANFDIVTKLMGTPKSTSVDPTPILTVFFIGMFGLALSEAGYGLVVLLLTGYLLSTGRVKPAAQKLISVLFYSSISVLIVGALFGSWFGLVPDNVTEATLPHVELLNTIGLIPLLQIFQVVNPMNIVLQFMVATVVLGVVHLSIGNILGFLQAVKQNRVLDGILDSLSWLGLIILGVTLALTGAPTAIVYATLAYLLVMIFAVGRAAGNPVTMFAKGAFDMFFGLIGYLSDSLSYTRLVALGLATGIIANVINTLASLAGAGLVERGGIYFILGYLIMAIIFVFGHIFNILLNIVGTYINVGRLHFVEFFSKFYESGGSEIQPFAPSENHIIVE